MKTFISGKSIAIFQPAGDKEKEVLKCTHYQEEEVFYLESYLKTAYNEEEHSICFKLSVQEFKQLIQNLQSLLPPD